MKDLETAVAEGKAWVRKATETEALPLPVHREGLQKEGVLFLVPDCGKTWPRSLCEVFSLGMKFSSTDSSHDEMS